MDASPDSQATTSVVKESVVRGHHVYKIVWNSLTAATSLLFFSAHSKAFNLKETSYDFLLDIVCLQQEAHA